MELAPKVKADIIRHIREELPKESCGLLILVKGKWAYRKCKNLSENNHSFIMDPLDYSKAEDEGVVGYVVHSHPYMDCQASEADRSMCATSGIPWLIFSYPNVKFSVIYPDNYQPPELIGREFSHGIFDCYTIIRDYYKTVKGIDIPNYERTDHWWNNGENLYEDNFRDAGFVEIDKEHMQVGDVLLIKVASPVLNHAAILSRDNIILHHLHGRISCEDIYGSYWRKATGKVLRYAKKS
jgi:proteasome lid subunit RPN8/RPN11